MIFTCFERLSTAKIAFDIEEKDISAGDFAIYADHFPSNFIKTEKFIKKAFEKHAKVHECSIVRNFNGAIITFKKL